MKNRFVFIALFFGLCLTLASFLFGCGDLTSSSNVVSSDVATENTSSEVAAVESMSNSMVAWAQSGAVTSVNALGIDSKTSTVTLDANGWYHITGTTSDAYATYEIDLYVKLIVNGVLQKVASVETYGTYTSTRTLNSYSIVCTQTYGSSSSPIVGSMTWVGDSISNVSINTGTITSTISGRLRDVSMTLTISNFSMPVTSSSDYPSGAISISMSYNGKSQDPITVTFDGTSNATITYGTYTKTFPIPAY